MISVATVASGPTYQRAAGLAMATFRSRASDVGSLSVYVPNGELIDGDLRHLSIVYSFNIEKFDYTLVAKQKFVSQLKCQWFVIALRNSDRRNPILLVDADTYCRGELAFSAELCEAIKSGRVGMVPDVKDRHTENESRPWYVPVRDRPLYVNSGVILASSAALDVFEEAESLSRTRAFLRGPFNDQKVLNFVLGTRFQSRLLYLDKKYNGMRLFRNDSTIIGHCAGGAGLMNTGVRRTINHERICRRLCGRNRS
jgi:hypothetical protein